MLYKKLGKTNLDISSISLGTMTFGEQTSENESFKIMDFAFEKGINFFDTAEMYPVYPKKETSGLSEKIIGNWMIKKKNRDKILIGTKVASSHPKGIGATKLSWIRGGGNNLKYDKNNLRKAVDASLKRLKTDYIDLYQLHWPERNIPIFGKLDFEYDPNDINWTPIEEVINNLNELVKIGKIRYYGVSNESPWGISSFLNIAKNNSLDGPITIQNGYNLINRVFDNSHSEISIRENCGLLAYSPLAAGRLTGKYLNKRRPLKSRFNLWPGRFSRHNTKRGEIAISKYIRLAKKYDIEPNLFAHAFVLSRPFVLSSIFGITTLNQLKDNIKSIDITLTAEILEEIQKIHHLDPNPCV